MHLPIGVLVWAICNRFDLSPALIVIAGVPLSIGLPTLWRNRTDIPGHRPVAFLARRPPISTRGDGPLRGPAE